MDSIKCAICENVYVIAIGNTVSSLIQTPKGQYQVFVLQKYLCYSDGKYSQVDSLTRTSKGQYQVCTLKKCLCYRDRKYS